MKVQILVLFSITVLSTHSFSQNVTTVDEIDARNIKIALERISRNQSSLIQNSPNLANWVNKTKNTVKRLRVPQSILILDKILPSPVVSKIQSAPSPSSYFKFMPTKDFEWTTKINRFSKMGIKDTADAILRLSGTDILVVAASPKKWLALNQENQGSKMLFAAAPPDSPTPNSLTQWLSSNLGYSGFIIDQIGNYFLVELSFEPQKNAPIFVYNATAKQNKINVAKQSVNAMLVAINVKQQFGVFHLALTRDKDLKIRAGDKVLAADR